MRWWWLLFQVVSQITYREATAPDGEPSHVAHFDADGQFEQDIFAVVALQNARFPVEEEDTHTKKKEKKREKINQIGNHE